MIFGLDGCRLWTARLCLCVRVSSRRGSCLTPLRAYHLARNLRTHCIARESDRKPKRVRISTSLQPRFHEQGQPIPIGLVLAEYLDHRRWDALWLNVVECSGMWISAWMAQAKDSNGGAVAPSASDRSPPSAIACPKCNIPTKYQAPTDPGPLVLTNSSTASASASFTSSI
jgi:hypothetical protein